jgi:hypothetical protein
MPLEQKLLTKVPHGVPFGFVGFEHCPVAWLQVPAS